jgi:pimeloyl-ACP methyl ester carboxylesterase
MRRFVLVPGANHGGWWYEPVVAGLQKAGHVADAVTLSGLHPDGPPAPAANLDTHIAEVVALLQVREEQGQVVLAGHSYGGSVITGVADHLPHRVAALVYLDAFVPDHGDTSWSMTKEWEHKWYIDDSGETGLAVAPLPFFDKRARPHPLGTLLQKSRLTGAYKSVKRKHFVAAVGAEWRKQSPFIEVAHRLRGDPGWVVTELDSSHNFLAHGPEALLRILLAEA